MLKSAGIYFLSALLVCATSASALDEVPPNIGGFDQSSWKDVPDTKLEGYIQALLDVNFYETQTEVHVKGKTAYLSNLPKNQLLTTSIKSFVQDIPGIERVVIVKTPGSRDGRMDEIKEKKKKKKISGVWFPQTNVLFQPLVADPRTVKYSLGYRMGDKVMGRRAAEVSFGDDFPLYRWKNVWVNGGDLQFGIEAGVWCVFSYTEKNGARTADQFAELMNSDFYAGLPLTYAMDSWSFRLRVYHISSHLGDEFLVNHPEAIDGRVNPSKEVLDFVASYQLTSSIRVYAGPGWVMHSDKTYTVKPWHFMYGLECRFVGFRSDYHGLYGQPFLAMFFKNDQEYDWEVETSYAIGYEWSKLQGIGRKVRLYLSYHHGHSLEGQFSRARTQYASVGFSYGF